MRLHELAPGKGAKRRRKRVGRGTAAGQGKTAGRGTKGQGSRSGGGPRQWFEGGQNTLRLPHFGGFTNIFRVEYSPVNLGRLDRFASGSQVDPQVLLDAGLIRSPGERVKVLAHGELYKALHIQAHAFSAAAKAKIEDMGGTWELLEPEPGEATE